MSMLKIHKKMLILTFSGQFYFSNEYKFTQKSADFEFIRLTNHGAKFQKFKKEGITCPYSGCV